MSDETTDTAEAPTRRDYLTYGGAVIGGGLLAGCAGQSESGSTPESTSNDTETTEATQSETGTDDGSYSVTMSPVGTVEFEKVPETAVGASQWIYLLTSLGQGHRVTGFNAEGLRPFYYDHYPDVSLDTGEMTDIGGANDITKEELYEVDPEIIHHDTFYLTQSNDAWDESDIEEIEENVAPFFANSGSRYWSESQYPNGEGYEFYTLEELTENFGQVYQVEDRARQLVELRQEVVAEVQSSLPPEDEQPSVGTILLYDGQIWAYLSTGKGYGRAATRPFGINDAFADAEKVYSRDGGTWDMEELLETDPDVLYLFDGLGWWFDQFDENRNTLAKDPVGSELSAVKNDRVYRGPPTYQGIPINLLMIEMVGKQLYPEQFGTWPGVSSDKTWEIPESERLFDRQRVADIINGEI